MPEHSRPQPRMCWTGLARAGSVLFLLLSPVGAGTADAATVSWVTDADGFWDVGANWSTGNPPQAGDDVVINRPGFDIAVTIRVATAAIATLNASEMVKVESTLTATGDVFFDGGLLLTGQIDGAGTKQLRSAGQWSSGSIAAGTFVVNAAKTLTIGTGSAHDLTSTTLVNHGTVTWTGGSFNLNHLASATNSATGLWDVQGDLTLSGNGQNVETFTNAGTLQKSVGTGALQVTNLVDFVNTGTIELQTGPVTFAKVWTSSGAISVASGVTLSLANGTLQAGATITGAGALSLNGTTTLSTNLTVSQPTTLTGTLLGTGVWTLGGPFTWNSGAFNNGGLVVPVGQTLTVSTSNAHDLTSTTLVNHGTVTWTGGAFNLNYLASATNSATGLWDVQGDLTLSGNGQNVETFTNAGTFRKSAGAGVVQVTNVVDFVNTGTIDLQTGPVTFSKAWISSGVLSVASGVTLSLANGTLQTGTTITGAGALTLPGTTTLSTNLTVTQATALSGTLLGTGVWTLGAPFTWTSGSFSNGGLVVPVGQTLTMSTGNAHDLTSTTLVNHGTVTWTGGAFNLNYVAGATNSATGLWDAQGDLTLSGNGQNVETFTNAGTFRKSAGAGGLNVTNVVDFVNTGTIELQTGPMTFGKVWTSSGAISVASGVTLSLANGTLQAGTTITGTGALSLNGTTTLSTNLTVTQPTTLAGTLLGTGIWTLGAPFTWTSGSFSNGGLVVPVGQTLTMNTGNAHDVTSTTLVNHGTVTWTGGSFNLNYLSSATNASTGLWDAQGALTFSGNGQNVETFTNAGTLRKSGVGLLQITNAVDFANTGTVEVQTDTIVFGKAWTSSGVLSVASGVTFSLANATLQTGTTITGAGALSLPGTTTLAASLTVPLPALLTGTLAGAGTWTVGAPMTWQSGSINNGGLVVPLGQTLTITSAAGHDLTSTTLVNHGTVTWLDGSFNLNYVASATNAATGAWDVQGNLTISGNGQGAETFTNAGTLRKTGAVGTITITNVVQFTSTGTVAVRVGGTGLGQFDRLLANVVTLGGTLDVTRTNGFVPAFDDTFNVMTYTSRTGAFAVIEGHDDYYDDSYSASVLTLTAVTAPEDGELIRNGDFSQGTSFWMLFGAPTTGHLEGSVVNEIMQWRRLPGVAGAAASQGVIFQETGAAIPNDGALTATFKLGNTASTRKYVKVLLVSASDFSDLSACTFWLAPNTPLRAFTMKTHTTKASTNIALYFYASSVKTDNGFYLLDDVSLKFTPEESLERTDCIDSLAPTPTLDPDSENLVNGGFSKTTLPPWATFGTVTVRAPVTAGVLEFTRPTGAFPPGVVLQSTGQPMTAGLPLTATLQLGNSSGVRKRVLLLVHDSDFSDLSACTWWLEPGQALENYAMKLFTTKAWTNATVSIYASSVGVQEWTRVDNVTLRRTPSATTVGTECLEGSQAGATVASWAGLKTGPSVGDASAWAVQYGAAGLQTGGTRDLAVAGSPQPEAGRDPASVLTLDPIDLTAAVDPRLTFESWLSGAAPRADVQVSRDGFDWITAGSAAPSDSWQAVDIDLGSFAGEVIFVRFVLHPGPIADEIWRIRRVTTASGG